MLILSFNWLLNELKTFIKKENCVVFLLYFNFNRFFKQYSTIIKILYIYYYQKYK